MRYHHPAVFGIPPRFAECALGNFNKTGQEDKIEKAKLAIETGASVFLSGVCGSGKTHLAISLMWQALVSHNAKCETAELQSYEQPSWTAEFKPSVELFFDLKQSFNSETSESEIIDSLCARDLIVLDDIGAEKVSDWSRQMCYLLIDRFYRYNKQLIVTSNLSLGQLAQHIDDRIASRLTEMGEIITLNPVDYRLKLRVGQKNAEAGA